MLTTGVRIGPYEIVALIGQGGMGEVYRARDTKLNRDVALKVLPDLFAGDPERLARFQREAQVLASLKHQNIGTIYGLEEAGGVRALVLELVEGPTLAERIKDVGRALSGPPKMPDPIGSGLPLEETLPIARQIADALEAAHDHGVIHRDLKPSNIKVTPDGTVKVLDFGLAKLVQASDSGHQAAGPEVTRSPTMTTPGATRAGVILGTAAYMSPEQARGKVVDKRSDIWAFGCVLYEMLVGRRAFDSDDLSDTLAFILTKEPDWSALPASTPPAIRKLLRRCLEKDRKRRLADAADTRLEIDEALATESPTDVAQAAKPAKRSRERLAWALLVIAVLAAGALAVPATLYVSRAAPEPSLTRLDLVTPPTSDPFSFALSPDGRQLVFVATAGGESRLWLRPLDQTTAQPLAGTDGAASPFWAPDSRAIGFFASGKMKRINLAGGAPLELADAPIGRGGTWNRDGVIVFAPSSTGGFMRVVATGGTPVPVTRPGAGQGSHRWPQFLPDGRRFIFLTALGQPQTRGVYVAGLDGGEPTRVLSAETSAAYAPPGYLLLVSQGVLVAYAFDAIRATVAGEPIPVAQSLAVDEQLFRGVFSVSTAGVLAHRAGGGARRQLVWVDRTGKVLGAVGSPSENALAHPELAPNGQQVAANLTTQANPDVWLMTVGRGVTSRFTSDPAIDASPVWSPDGNRVVFRSSRNGVYDLFEKPASSAADEQPLLVNSQDKMPLDWSRDGRFLLFSTQGSKTASDLWALPMTGERPSTNSTGSGSTVSSVERSTGSGRPTASAEGSGEPGGSAGARSPEPVEARKPFPVQQTSFDEIQGQLSPDGRWLAYASNESGPYEIYVRPFPGPGGRWLVSAGGGRYPRWRRDGRELFYVTPDDRLTAVPIRLTADAPALDSGAAMALFQRRLAFGGNVTLAGFTSKAQYAVASDGRFLLNVADDEAVASPITVVLNWTAALQK